MRFLDGGVLTAVLPCFGWGSLFFMGMLFVSLFLCFCSCFGFGSCFLVGWLVGFAFIYFLFIFLLSVYASKIYTHTASIHTNTKLIRTE